MNDGLQKYDSYVPVEYDYVKQLPIGWQLLPNIAIFEERIERGYINEELLSVTINKGVIKQTDVDIKKDSSNEDKSKYKLVEEGDIAINKMRMWQGALGFSQYRGIVSPAYIVLKPKMKINLKFFHYMFRASFYTNYSKRFSYGIVDDQLSLRYTDFKRMYSIVPPLEIQNFIVAYLDSKNEEIDKFIKSKELLIALFIEGKNSIIFKAITKGIKDICEMVNVKDSWLGCMPSGWKIYRGRQLFKIFGGLAPSEVKLVLNVEASKNAVDYYKVDDLNNTQGFMLNESSWKVESKKIRVYSPNTILLPKRGAAIMTNKVTITTTPATFDSNVMGIKVNERLVRTDYVSYWLKSRNLIELADITTIPQLNNKHIYPLLIPLPNLEEQEEIINHIEMETKKLDLLIDKVRKEISVIAEYRKSLITNTILGKKAVCN
jgi:type I restriction enzyme S subunit